MFVHKLSEGDSSAAVGREALLAAPQTIALLLLLQTVRLVTTTAPAVTAQYACYAAKETGAQVAQHKQQASAAAACI